MSISLSAPPASPSATAVKSSVSGEGHDKIEDSVNLHHLMKLMSIFEVRRYLPCIPYPLHVVNYRKYSRLSLLRILISVKEYKV